MKSLVKHNMLKWLAVSVYHELYKKRKECSSVGEWKCVDACCGPPATVTCVEVMVHISQHIGDNKRLGIDRNCF